MPKNVKENTNKQTERKPALPSDKASFSKDAAESRRQYRIEQISENRLPCVIMLFMAFVMECMMIFIYVVSPHVVHNDDFFPQYIYLYISMTVISPVLLILLHIFKQKPEILRLLEYAVLWLLGIWSAVFSAFDVINGFSAYLFIQIVIINSVIFHIRPVVHCLINLLSFLVYLGIVLFGNLDMVSLFAEIINPFFMTTAACIILLFSDRLKFKAFVNRELIQEQHRQLEFYANNDYLTRIPNRKSIIEYLEGAISSETAAISCMMIDIDNFKLYNDTYGHVMGDHCLVRLTSVMNQAVESRGGRIGRYGGEEFLAVFVEKSEKELIETADEIRNTVRNEQIEFSTSDVLTVVTVSIGVYRSDVKNIDQDTLLSNSDQALYRAKKEGRNRVCVYSEAKKTDRFSEGRL